MIAIGGINALTGFKKTSLTKRLQTADPAITGVAAEFMHFIDGEVSGRDRRQLEELLAYGESFTDGKQGDLFVVVPRPGTISPWASKATDIAKNSGIRGVRRIERGTAFYVTSRKPLARTAVRRLLYDRMTEVALDSIEEAEKLFSRTEPRPYKTIDISGKHGKAALKKADRELLLALSPDEIDYLYASYRELGRNPTDAELMMFGAVNSEHCRHKIFNADWEINGTRQPKSLFSMIKHTHKKSPGGVLSAYSDNAAVLEGGQGLKFLPDPETYEYANHKKYMHLVIKAETHNHPTAISPYPGSATGAGGEIRDEAATGRGAASKMGLAGFSVSNLHIPGHKRPWEKSYGRPDRITSAFDIMIEGPLGSAGFGNEFGRPTLTGYFRSFEQSYDDEIRGYHKPIMIGGGLGNITGEQLEKQPLPVGAALIVLGGPAMLIGLGGGSGSSVESGSANADLDFASVQRGNAEMQRRTQEVINACTRLNENNPLLSIHDVGAGGLSNALPELVHDSGRGAAFELRDIPNDEPGMSPMEIWSNEAQERFVLAVDKQEVEQFRRICERERCPFAVVGHTTKEETLVVSDRHFNNQPVDIPMALLFGKPPKLTRQVARRPGRQTGLELDTSLDDAVKRVLQLPAVASKKFLITIGDRTVSGLVARDQMIGPWQVPVSDVAVTSRDYAGQQGEAMAMGERPPLALIDSAASARMAVGEAITNIAAASIDKLSDIKLSANWMAAAGHGAEDEKLFDAVRAIGEEFCPELGIAIPVGKDSLSMRTIWEDDGKQKSVTAPLSLVISAFAPVADVTATVTPQLSREADTLLVAVDLGQGRNRLGGSALAQVYNQSGGETPDIAPAVLKDFFLALARLKRQGKILAYHDRSDGGLLATLAEMSFASRLGLDINLDALPGASSLEQLFSEELGAVIQVRAKDEQAVLKHFDSAYVIGRPADKQDIVFRSSGGVVYKNTRAGLERLWADTSYRMQSFRDNPDCARQEFSAIDDDKDPGLAPKVPFKLSRQHYKIRPKIAVLREQGVNGHMEMAAAFDRAGFAAFDVHMQDIMTGRINLADFKGLAACGGFSYGDVLGGGGGWAKSVLFNSAVRSKFEEFFGRSDTFSLGICNGCQMLATLKDLIPGADHWPRFLGNTSSRFEARLVMARVNETPSILFKGMEGAVLPVPTAHGEGRAVFDDAELAGRVLKDKLAPMQFVDNYGKVTERYPSNPNGSQSGITALTSRDGRATIIMPHPERVFLTKQLSWHPGEWEAESPWFRLFQNAREWVV